MDVRISAKVDMFNSSIDFLGVNTAITAAIPTFATATASATALLTQIQQTAMLQDEDLTGNELDKVAAKQALITNSIALSGSLTAYATAVNNNVLLKMVDFTPSDFKRASDAKLKEDANILYTQGLPLVLLLAAYGVTAASLTSFNTSIATFTTLRGKPKTSIAIRKQQTALLKSLVKQVDTIFVTKIDKLMLLVRNTSLPIYIDYANIRKINQPAQQKIALKIHITDFDTVQALPGVIFSIDTVAKPLKTTKKGNAQRKHLPFGVLKAKATKAGYASQDFEFAITQGQTTRLVIVMKKQPGVIVPTFKQSVSNVS